MHSFREYRFTGRLLHIGVDNTLLIQKHGYIHKLILQTLVFTNVGLKRYYSTVHFCFAVLMVNNLNNLKTFLPSFHRLKWNY